MHNLNGGHSGWLWFN